MSGVDTLVLQCLQYSRPAIQRHTALIAATTINHSDFTKLSGIFYMTSHRTDRFFILFLIWRNARVALSCLCSRRQCWFWIGDG